MACNACKTPFLRIVATRGYAAQTSAKAAASGSSHVQSKVLPNKLVVASAESKLPITRVSIVFRAGSRNETYDGMGAAHMLRVCAGLTTKCSSGFKIMRHLQQEGIHLSASSNRELIIYTIDGTCDKIDSGLNLLQDVATGPAFKPWELKDVASTLRTQVLAVPKDVRAVELLHRAAYRSGLGNSINCPKYHIGKLSTETMMEFFNNTCTTNRGAIVGVGIDQNTLLGFAQCLDIESGEGRKTASKYYGNGEIRKHRSSSSAHVAVAGEGAALTNKKEALAFSILRHAYGVKTAAKRGNVNGAIGKAVASAVPNNTFKIKTINKSYTDSGLFGFLISTDGRNAGKAVEAAVKILKSGSVSSEDINRGKALAKASVLRKHASDAGVLKSLGKQAALLGNVQSGEDIAAEIDAISAADVQAVAKKVASSKLSMGAVGHLEHVPHLSDLA